MVKRINGKESTYLDFGDRAIEKDILKPISNVDLSNCFASENKNVDGFEKEYVGTGGYTKYYKFNNCVNSEYTHVIHEGEIYRVDCKENELSWEEREYKGRVATCNTCKTDLRGMQTCIHCDENYQQ